MATKDRELQLASGTAIGHIDHGRWEYWNEMVVRSPELGLDPAVQSPHLCFSIYKIDFFFFFVCLFVLFCFLFVLIPLLKYRPFCATKPGQRRQFHKEFKVLRG